MLLHFRSCGQMEGSPGEDCHSDKHSCQKFGYVRAHLQIIDGSTQTDVWACHVGPCVYRRIDWGLLRIR
jgi:hypothetical protein